MQTIFLYLLLNAKLLFFTLERAGKLQMANKGKSRQEEINMWLLFQAVTNDWFINKVDNFKR